MLFCYFLYILFVCFFVIFCKLFLLLLLMLLYFLSEGVVGLLYYFCCYILLCSCWLVAVSIAVTGSLVTVVLLFIYLNVMLFFPNILYVMIVCMCVFVFRSVYSFLIKFFFFSSLLSLILFIVLLN